MVEKLEKIRVSCEAAATLDLDKLTPFQSDLKDLPETNYKKLKRAIIKYGFSFPLYVWVNGGTNYCIDGHQRDRVLRRMREEGYKIPSLPCAFIKAANMKEAKEKVLLAASVYGKVNRDGFAEFLEASEISLEDLKHVLDLPDLDLKNFVVDKSAAPLGVNPEDVDLSGVVAPTGEYIALKFDSEKECLEVKETLGMKRGARVIEWAQAKKLLKL